MEDMLFWTKVVMNGHWFYLISAVSLFILIMFMNKRRTSFVFPLLLLSAVVLNPLFYFLWNKYAGYAYWRMLWLLPVIPFCSAMPCVILEKIKSQYTIVKSFILIAFIITYIFMGTFFYTDSWGNFDIPSDNYSKLPKEAIEVSNYLLSIDDNPMVVVAPEKEYVDKLGVEVVKGLQDYIRQFSGKIKLMYGRHGYSGEKNEDINSVFNNLLSEECDYSFVANVMINEGYNYLVIKDNDLNIQDKIRESGFEELHHVDDYGIYKVLGKSNIIKERNDLGQIIEESFVDDEGNIINGEKGYATINYEYDKNGNTIKEFRTDKEGKAVLNEYGVAGWERQYNYKSQVIMERFIGEEGLPTKGNMDYCEIRRKYGALSVIEEYYNVEGEPILISEGYSKVIKRFNSTNKCISEQYFDNKDNPTLLLEGYSKVVREYDRRDLCVTEKYYDNNNKLTITTDGYAQICREYNDNKLCVKEMYYDENEKPCIQTAGYCGKKMEYNENNLISSLEYLNEYGETITRKDGIAKICWEENVETGTRDIEFYDLNGNEISIEKHNLAKDLRYGEDGWSKWMVPQRNVVNNFFNIGTANLGNKKVGDIYTCCICIEFSNVTATEGETFRFWTIGTADGKLGVGNVWNDSLVYIEEAPENGVYYFTSRCSINEPMMYATDFGIGFRCDNWASGSFRVKDVMIVKGEDDSLKWMAGL